jgi:hypothetical protein
LDIAGLQQNIARDEDEFRAGFVRPGLLALSLFFDLILAWVLMNGIGFA